jgi:hypothetical protein
MRIAILLAVGALGLGDSLANTVPFHVQGRAWVDAGRIMNSSDSTQYDPNTGPYTMNLNDTWLQSSGAQFTVTAELGKNWEGAFGVGAHRVTHALGEFRQSEEANFLAISMYKSYLTEARVTYFRGEREAPWLSLTVGNFAHKYNPDVKNLGLYLLRGPVYPGVLMGGYGNYAADPSRADLLGARVHHAAGSFSHDLIFMNERDLPPTFDWSLAYVAKYRPFQGFEVGAGINFHRLIPYNSDLTTPGKLDPNVYDIRSSMYEVDDASGDTTFYTHQGTKLMAMFSLDLKQWVQWEWLGANDLRLYGETAVIGVKDYGEAYGDILERIPVLLGFNFPSFGLLDLLSLEVEWYGSPHRNDLAELGNPGSIVADWTVQNRLIPSPGSAPVEFAHSKRDNWKWSLNLEKIMARHVVLSAQVANDHYRPRSIATGLITAAGGTAGAFTTPEDWYFTLRLGFLF